MTNIQCDVLNSLALTYSLMYWDYDTDGKKIVATYTEGNDRYVRFTIDENGESVMDVFRIADTTTFKDWSMEEHDWTHFKDPEEKSGDESFDVVVENKLKEEKKMAINFSELYKEAYEEAFSDYVHSNKSDLVAYAEDSARQKILDHLNDDVDFEDVAHNIIDEVIDYYIEYDSDSSDDALEEIITDCIFE